MNKYEIHDPDEISDVLTFGITDQDCPLGYAKLSNNNGVLELEDLYLYDHTQANSNIARLFKKLLGKKNYRGKRIGTYFLKHIIEFCRNTGAKRINGKASGDIPRLKAWYKSLGFTVDADNNIELFLDD
ncbi:MAG: GNAT family N-acetyltransferase [Desulfobulbaceae bacterium]|jgi:GNAT superfamily N-acetyltransferase|nr:GNAT family N-acetyltransferase [Desulfobulbaceae bacterium]